MNKPIILNSTIQSLNIEPTTELYAALQNAYDYFNQSLFEARLPKVIFTTQRQKNVMGYFSRQRWVSREGSLCHEIAINPSYVASSSLIELLQTLVHEITHCWQCDFGRVGRRGYHNKEWADKMESFGLMPSSTGSIGGARTGDRMSDYPIPDGVFIKECLALISTGFILPWVDRFTLRTTPVKETLSPELEALALEKDVMALLVNDLDGLLDQELLLPAGDIPKGRIKSKYSCPACHINVWGKPELNLSCNNCNEALLEQEG